MNRSKVILTLSLCSIFGAQAALFLPDDLFKTQQYATSTYDIQNGFVKCRTELLYDLKDFHGSRVSWNRGATVVEKGEYVYRFNYVRPNSGNDTVSGEYICNYDVNTRSVASTKVKRGLAGMLGYSRKVTEDLI